ncbi:MAG TPA: GNAT family N-acetyltransferase [Woeseiaceae bacterium]|nr:GNAT family N-acetyltransferase [Woeseiaceae bacterium]
MEPAFSLRRQLRPGDIGEITRMHGEFYSQEYGYGVAFEAYVAQGLAEFQHQYNAARDRVWLYEDEGRLVAMLFLMDRGDRAQLRYFLTHPDYRGRGLGKDLMAKFMNALTESGYTHSFLWTTDHLAVAASLYTRNGFVLTEQKASTRFGKPLVEMKYEWWAEG